MKKYKLKPGVKVGLVYMIICFIMIIFVSVYINKIEKINNGTIRVVPEREMSERN